MRRAVTVALAVLSSVLLGPAPPAAAAPTAAAFTGTVHISCFGCGMTTGTAALAVTGAVGGAFVSGPATAYFDAYQPVGASCVVSGTAAGVVTGAVEGWFAWSRVGPLAVFTVNGATTASGVATFWVTNPVGNPCGQAVTAQVTGVLVGDSAGAPPVPECSDGADNDLDLRADYPADPGCTDPSDTTENSDAPCSTFGPVCLQVTPGAPWFTHDAYLPTAVPSGPAHRVAGWVDVYAFPIPVVGGTAHVPCVVLVADSSTADACALAGGTFESRLLALVDRTEQERDLENGAYVTTVRVCDARLTATVLGIGVSNVPVNTLC